MPDELAARPGVAPCAAARRARALPTVPACGRARRRREADGPGRRRRRAVVHVGRSSTAACSCSRATSGPVGDEAAEAPASSRRIGGVDPRLPALRRPVAAGRRPSWPGSRSTTCVRELDVGDEVGPRRAGRRGRVGSCARRRAGAPDACPGRRRRGAVVDGRRVARSSLARTVDGESHRDGGRRSAPSSPASSWSPSGVIVARGRSGGRRASTSSSSPARTLETFAFRLEVRRRAQRFRAEVSARRRSARRAARRPLAEGIWRLSMPPAGRTGRLRRSPSSAPGSCSTGSAAVRRDRPQALPRRCRRRRRSWPRRRARPRPDERGGRHPAPAAAVLLPLRRALAGSDDACRLRLLRRPGVLGQPDARSTRSSCAATRRSSTSGSSGTRRSRRPRRGARSATAAGSTTRRLPARATSSATTTGPAGSIGGPTRSACRPGTELRSSCSAYALDRPAEGRCRAYRRVLTQRAENWQHVVSPGAYGDADPGERRSRSPAR